MGMDKEMKRLVRAAVKRGWQLVQGRHFVLQHPSGRKVAFSRSPSDRNAYLNLERDILRAEDEIEMAQLQGDSLCNTTPAAAGVVDQERNAAVALATAPTAAVPATSRRRRSVTAVAPTSVTLPSPAWPRPQPKRG